MFWETVNVESIPEASKHLRISNAEMSPKYRSVMQESLDE